MTDKDLKQSPGGILLVLLPFWTPLIPPLGIAGLKAFLNHHGFTGVTTVDLNIETQFSDINTRYFNELKACIPPDKRGNFNNIGNQVFRNHLMAHINRENEPEYRQLTALLIENNFFCTVPDQLLTTLICLLDEFYTRLENYFTFLLEQHQPGVLGLSVYRDSLPASLFAFKLAKQQYPRIKTIMGGGVFADQLAMESPAFKQFVEKTPYIDHIVVGEGENIFLQLLEGKLPQQKVYSLADIDNNLLDLAQAQPPDFSDFNLDYYPYLASYASRSCPFQCAFCSETIQWGNYRKKDAAKIVRELHHLYETYGFQLFLMGDSLLNPVIKELSQEVIETGASFYWDGYLRADKEVCNPDNTYMWRRGGMYRARLGLESGSGRILELMSKRITPDQIKQAVSALARMGIKTTTYWVIGFPGETEADFQMTLDLIEEMKNDIYEAEYNPFNYFLTGQVGSGDWADKKSRLLYPERFSENLLVPTYVLEESPGFQETMERGIRFAAHCRKLGIPNPYTLNEIFKADERWLELHENAVPPQMAFKNKQTFIDENKQVKRLIMARAQHQESGDFNL